MPQYRVYKREFMTMLPAEQVVPILPLPHFRSNTSHMKVVQGGFLDDAHRWHAAPKHIKEAVRVNGVWYWVCKMRDRKGRFLLEQKLLVPVLDQAAGMRP